MSRETRRQGYSRLHRFAERGSFGPVLRSSRKLRGRLAVIHVAPGRSPNGRLGLALTRRLVPLAVDRSLVKRIVREAFRRHAVKASGLDCVLTLRARFERGQAAAIGAEAGELFSRLAAGE
jgi:ribonuclease P protein component